jgi:hypothetical protein
MSARDTQVRRSLHSSSLHARSRVPGAPQRADHLAEFAELRHGAVQNRDPCLLAAMDPGSAAHHFVLRRVHSMRCAPTTEPSEVLLKLRVKFDTLCGNVRALQS